MAVYSELARVEVQRILSDFGEKAKSYELLSGGSANTNYYVSSNKGDRLLTIGESISEKDLKLLIDLLNHLETNRFDSSRVFFTIEGKPWTYWHGKPVTLKTFVKGRVPVSMNQQDLTLTGLALAHLHKVPAPDFVSTTHRYGLERYEDLENIYKVTNEFAKWLSGIHDHLLAEIPSDLPRCLIHGDLFDNNVVITPDEQAIILDFEEACKYYRVFDIGMAIAGCCCPDEFDPVKARALVAAYMDAGNLTEREQETLPLFCCYAAASTAFWRYRQFHFVKPSPVDQERYRQMKQLADYFRAVPASIFFS